MDESSLPILIGINQTTPGFEDGVFDAVVRKAEKLAAGNKADIGPFALSIARDVMKARSLWNPDKGSWAPFAGRAIKWSAMRINERQIGAEREYRALVCSSIDAPLDESDEESESFGDSQTQDAFSESHRLENRPAEEDLIRRVRLWVETLDVDSRKFCEAFLAGHTSRELEQMTGVPRSSQAAYLRRLAAQIPKGMRELLPMK